LKSADLGVALGTGTDIAIDSAEVVIANGSLTALNKAIKISEKALKIIKQNLFWAFFYNTLGIPVAAGAFAALGVTLTPWIASIMMSLSSLFVVTNALRLSGKSNKNSSKQKNAVLKTITVTVEGMMCGHCKSKVESALQGLDGVISVGVDLDKKTATLKVNSEVAEQDIKTVILNAGFNVIEIKK
jgi:cation transport ATPase